MFFHSSGAGHLKSGFWQGHTPSETRGQDMVQASLWVPVDPWPVAWDSDLRGTFPLHAYVKFLPFMAPSPLGWLPSSSMTSYPITSPVTLFPDEVTFWGEDITVRRHNSAHNRYKCLGTWQDPMEQQLC